MRGKRGRPPKTKSAQESDLVEGRHSILVPDELWKFVEAMSRTNDMSESAVVRFCIESVIGSKMFETFQYRNIRAYLETCQKLSTDMTQLLVRVVERTPADLETKHLFRLLDELNAILTESMNEVPPGFFEHSHDVPQGTPHVLKDDSDLNLKPPFDSDTE
jgi:hypothetical protein